MGEFFLPLQISGQRRDALHYTQRLLTKVVTALALSACLLMFAKAPSQSQVVLNQLGWYNVPGTSWPIWFPSQTYTYSDIMYPVSLDGWNGTLEVKVVSSLGFDPYTWSPFLRKWVHIPHAVFGPLIFCYQVTSSASNPQTRGFPDLMGIEVFTNNPTGFWEIVYNRGKNGSLLILDRVIHCQV